MSFLLCILIHTFESNSAFLFCSWHFRRKRKKEKQGKKELETLRLPESPASNSPWHINSVQSIVSDWRTI